METTTSQLKLNANKLTILVLVLTFIVSANTVIFGNDAEGDYPCSGGGGPYFVRYTLYQDSFCHASTSDCDPNYKYGGNPLITGIYAPAGTFSSGEFCARISKYYTGLSTIIYSINNDEICRNTNPPWDGVYCCNINSAQIRMGNQNEIKISVLGAGHVVARTDGLPINNWCGSPAQNAAIKITINYRNVFSMMLNNNDYKSHWQ